jgi:predicted Holliday junction resolvase-like endonuclease
LCYIKLHKNYKTPDPSQAMDIITIILAIIILIGLFFAYKIGFKQGSFQKDKLWKEELPFHRKEAILRSRAVLGGHFSENLAPFLPDFKYLPNECVFVGKPIDFLVFKGMDEKKIDEVVFVEVKSGKSKVSPQEKNLKEAIEKKRVRWEEYRIPKELTEKKDIEEKIEKEFLE